MTVPKILVLDDNTSIRRAIMEGIPLYLPKRRVECYGCGTAEGFFEQAHAQPWDLFVLDYRLNGVSGIDVLNRLEKEGAKTPVIFFTGYAKDVERDLGVHPLVHGVIEKPDLEHLAFQADVVLGAAEFEKAGVPPAQELKSGFWETGSYSSA